MATREAPYVAETFFRGLKGLLLSLPSEEEKAELIGALMEAQKLLEELRALAEATPTVESSAELSAGLSRLTLLADQASGDPKLRRVLGLRSPAAPKPSRFPASEDAEARAAALEEELQAMATDDVVASLERSKESVAVLAALARRLGMRVGSKGRKSDLAKRIATHIANQRSYDFLRNRTARAS